MTVRVRFAPSPTGHLHVGNIRTALVNFLFAKKSGGQFILRIDDTDRERSRLEFETAIEVDMKWLGLVWDEKHRQSDRNDLYEKSKQKLIADGRLYECFETAEELDVKRKFQLSRGEPPIYDRASLRLTAEEKSKLKSEGRKSHFRFKLNDAEIFWNDLVRGENRFHGKNLGDPILLREDGVPTYTLSSVVDDGDLKITHVIRGEDHVSNTAVQIQLFEALFGKAPEFAHISLLKSKDGEISKRLGGFDIGDMRNKGILPMAILSLLSRIGTSMKVELLPSLDALAETIDFKTFSRSQANYDYAELERLNAHLLATLSFAEVKPHLGAIVIDENLWRLARDNIKTLSELNAWKSICIEQISPVIADNEFTQDAALLLPETPWDSTTWSKWVESIKGKTGRKGKELFMPLRLALTGREDGPELAKMLPVIGREKAEKRLKGIAA